MAAYADVLVHTYIQYLPIIIPDMATAVMDSELSNKVARLCAARFLGHGRTEALVQYLLGVKRTDAEGGGSITVVDTLGGEDEANGTEDASVVAKTDTCLSCGPVTLLRCWVQGRGMACHA